MSKKQFLTVEKNIYVEDRCGAFRFKVVVHPLKDSATFSTMAQGLAWARQRRVDMLGEKAGLAKPISSFSPTHQVQSVGVLTVANETLESIRLCDVFDSFESSELAKLAGESPEASRLGLLRKCFGGHTLDQLDEDLMTRWKNDRLAGKFGSGRAPLRAAALGKSENDTPLTKHQRYALRKKGVKIETKVHPVSSQSVRHELSLLRRAITKYLNAKNRWPSFGASWQAHYLTRMSLPEAAKPRSRRVSDDELDDIFNHITKREMKAAILFAIQTSLRRNEILSLRWEDVDFKNLVVHLRKMGHGKKSKVNEREVPLLPGAIQILKDLKPQERGPIFEITPSSFSAAWRQSADKADIFDARLHDCRRESISRLVGDCAVPIAEVLLFSGHKEQRTLERHYLRLSASKVAARLAQNPGVMNLSPSL